MIPGEVRRSVNLAASACRTRLDALALADLHSGLVVDGGGPHALLDLSCHRQESLFDIRGIFGGSLKERDSQTIGKFLGKSGQLSWVQKERHEAKIVLS